MHLKKNQFDKCSSRAKRKVNPGYSLVFQKNIPSASVSVFFQLAPWEVTFDLCVAAGATLRERGASRNETTDRNEGNKQEAGLVDSFSLFLFFLLYALFSSAPPLPQLSDSQDKEGKVFQRYPNVREQKNTSEYV